MKWWQALEEWTWSQDSAVIDAEMDAEEQARLEAAYWRARWCRVLQRWNRKHLGGETWGRED